MQDVLLTDLSTTFFERLPVMKRPLDTFDPADYTPAPDDWCLVVTDIIDSTAAIANGRHKAVNFVAAMAIAALKNCCAPHQIPFLFGGDGVVVMVPPQYAAESKVALARVRSKAALDFDLELRVGMVAAGSLRANGRDIRVGRFEPSPGNSFGVFAGGGVSLLEETIKGGGDPSLAAEAVVPEALNDGLAPDLSGLSCRWNALQSRRGKMMTIIVVGAPQAREIYAGVLARADQDGDSSPAHLDSFKVSWPPKNFMLEAKARHKGGLLAMTTAKLLVETLLAFLIFSRGRVVGKFDPVSYREEMATNTDFCQFDQTLCFVLDCTTKGIDEISEYLKAYCTARNIRYGIDVADTALMTCLVTDPSEGLHVHFIDGGNGGYTNAATRMKT
ncbi:MAG: DUF3095 family protein [Burkholderiaceae bacterium]